MRNGSRFSVMALPAVRFLAVAAIITACAGVEVTDPDDQGPVEPSVRVVSLTPRSGTLSPGAQMQLLASVTLNGSPDPSPAISWLSSNTSVATVSSTGVVQAVSPGSVTVVAAVGTVSDQADLTVVPPTVPVASVAMAPSSATVAVGATVTLSATPRSSTGQVLTGRAIAWSSSDNGIATVTQAGVVQGQVQGSATITAESEGQRATAAVTVSPVPVASVSLSSTSMSLTAPETRSITAFGRDGAGAILPGRSATWSSSNTAVATVSSTGISTANVSTAGAGTATITATMEGRTASAQVTVAVPAPAPVATVTVSPATSSVSVGATRSLSAQLRDAAGNLLTGRVVSWSSNLPGVATVNTSGVVSGVSQGTATITATSEGRSGTATVTVTSSTSGAITFANEPSGMTRFSDWSFPTLTGSGWTYSTEQSIARIVQDATAPTDASVVEFVFGTGFTGGEAPGRVSPPPFTTSTPELYWAFTFKANAAWQGHTSGINKIGYGWQNGQTLWGLTWYWYDGVPNISLFDQGSNLTYYMPNTAQAAPVRAGEWHEVELQYRPSSAPGRADGIVRIWVNGVLMNNHVNVVTTSGAISDIYFEPTWGGVGDTKRANDYFRFGQTRISVR